MEIPTQLSSIHYLPIATTLFSAAFAVILFKRYFVRRSGLHLLWWGWGVTIYGLGTALESAITITGNSVALTKAWYIAGALLGGYPLAQGSVYLLLNRTTANKLTVISLPVIVTVAAIVVLSPMDAERLIAFRPSGDALGWWWVRAMTPIINMYAVVFLIGGAIYSAAKFRRKVEPGAGHRALGNSLIAFGAILPGIGGSLAKTGITEALYIGELVGLIFIWLGFDTVARGKTSRQPPYTESAA